MPARIHKQLIIMAGVLSMIGLSTSVSAYDGDSRLKRQYAEGRYEHQREHRKERREHREERREHRREHREDRHWRHSRHDDYYRDLYAKRHHRHYRHDKYHRHYHDRHHARHYTYRHIQACRAPHHWQHGRHISVIGGIKLNPHLGLRIDLH